MSDTGLRYSDAITSGHSIVRPWGLIGGIALIFAAVAGPAVAMGGPPDAVHVIIALALGSGLVALASIDLAMLRLPDPLTYSLLAGGLMSAAASPSRLTAAVLGAALGFGLLWSVAAGYRGLRGNDGLGLGDAKLLAAAGAWVGAEALPTVLLIASVLALASAAVWHVAGTKMHAQTRIPFGPFLAFGFWLAWLYGPGIV